MNWIRTLAPALVITSVFAVSAHAQAAPRAAGNVPVPPPGSPGAYLSNSELQAALAESVAEGDEPAVSPISRTDEYRGSLVRRTRSHGAIAHPGYTELHYIIEGSGEITTGGSIVRADGAPADIRGGETRPVAVGDIIVIPEGSAHMYSRVDEPITYLEFRWAAPD